MEGVKILKCTCIHVDQDDMHGEQMRVHNVSVKGVAKCTVCSSERKGEIPVVITGNASGKKAKS